jgi:hypothetical protein
MLQSDYSTFNPLLFLECERHRNDAGEVGRHFSVVANPKLRPGTNLIKLLFHFFFSMLQKNLIGQGILSLYC